LTRLNRTKFILDTIGQDKHNLVKQILYELTNMLLAKEVAPEICYPIYESILNSHDFTKNIIIECLWMLGCDWDKPDILSPDAKNRYVGLVQFLISKGLISSRVLLERLEENTLTGCALIADADLFARKRNRVQTRLMYEQQKYNLLREESEGFAKIITELTISKLSPKNVDIVQSNIKSLIGFFDLDPNRVLDLILEIFEKDYENLAFITLITSYNKTALPQIIGFKFQKEREIPNKLPENSISLYRETAQLLKAGCFELSDIWPYLYPDDKEMENLHTEKVALSRGIASRTNIVKLGGTAESHQADKEREHKELEDMKKQHINNQKLWLLESLIRVNAWNKVEELYHYLKDYFDASTLQALIKSLIDMCHWSIEPVYRKISPTRNFTNFVPNIPNFPENALGIIRSEDFQQFYNNINKILKLLGINISQDPLLFTKICRVIRASLKSEKEKPQDSGNYLIKDIAFSLCTKILLPSLSLIKCNPGICAVLWDVLAEFDYTERYTMYNECLTVAYFGHPQLTVQYALSSKDTHKWLKRFAKANARQAGKTLAKLSHSNPCLLFDLILTQMKAYENQIQVLVSTLANCSLLALDIVAYVTLRHVSDDKPKLENDGGVSPWLRNLSAFCGQFFRKYYWVDAKSIFHYICGKFKQGDVSGMIVLSEIMSRMTGYAPLDLDKMSDKQFEAMAGGKHLQVVALSFSSEVKRAKTSSHALVQLFWKRTKKETSGAKIFPLEKPLSSPESLSLAMCINVLMSQNLQTLFYKKDARQLKFESNVYDRLKALFLQFNTFISSEAENNEHYEQLLPYEAAYRFISQYKLPPEYVFPIIVPALKPLYEYSESDYQRLIQLAKDILDKHIANRFSHFEKREPSEYFDESKYLHEKLGGVWDAISPELYAIFWYMQLQDISVPKERYDEEITKLNNEISGLQKELKDGNNSDTASINKKLERNKQIISNLNAEYQKQAENNKKYLAFLESRKDHIISKITKKSELSSTFIQYCIFPRLMNSPSDAIYSIKIITALFKLRVKLINILDILGVLLKQVLPAIQCSTEKEAYNYGIFFLEVFKLIHYWQDDHVWKNECFGSPGFTRSVGSTSNIDLDEFKNSITVIYKKVALPLQKCIDSEEYMQVFLLRKIRKIKGKKCIDSIEKIKSIFP